MSMYYANRFIIIYLIGLLVSMLGMVAASTAYARYDPLSVPNNRLGIHVLDPGEVKEAAELVNSNGGEWGYVTIPIRADDRDRKKWQEFFQACTEFKLIPLLRVATYGRGETWVAPSEAEMLDFANFLNEMPWPTGNRYLMIFNEVNHSREWGGYIEPEKYAEILSYTIDIFKSKHPDYFVMPAAMDHAAPNNHTSISGMNYIKRMFAAQPDLVQRIDGWNAHAYPNPGFVGKPGDKSMQSIISYRHELDYLKKLGRSTLPVFITETGWDQTKISAENLKSYWQHAYSSVWTEPNIVAITPFLLQAHDGPFTIFSFIDVQKQPKVGYTVMKELPKTAGSPEVVSGIAQVKGDLTTWEPVREWTEDITWPQIDLEKFLESIQSFFTDMFVKKQEVTIGDVVIPIEVADSPQEVTQGLGYRQSMPENQGMLFVYKDAHVPTFWMKNTLFPLDIIWIRDDKVVDLTTQIPVEANPDQPQNFYSPKVESNYVLEVNAGFVEKQQIKVGDSVTIRR